MLNVSTALSTLAPPGTPAPAKLAGGDFQDLLGGLGIAPVADPLLAVPAVKVALPGLCAIAPIGPTMVAVPVTGGVAAPTMATVPDTDATIPVANVAIAPPPTVPPEKMPEPASLLPTLPGKRQALADGGKPLPDDVADDDPSEDVIWLTASLQPVPTPVAQPSASPKVNAPVVSSAVVPATAVSVANIAPATDAVGGADVPAATPAQAGAQATGAIAPSLPSPHSAPASAGVAAGDVAPVAPARTDAPAVVLPVATRPDLPVRTDTPVPATAQPAPLQQAPLQPAPAILPAAQAFAAAIAAVVQQGRDEREAGDSRAPLALATATLDRLHAPAIAAPADMRQAALDLRQDSGLQGMIDHIEVLRDGANAGDTRIRLIPDALGAVDVSVRRDGERLHVHFNAETQASARLIADAQPRLAELADARGVKLGQTSVDSGDGQSRQQQPATPIQFTRPAPAADSTDTPDDLRVA